MIERKYLRRESFKPIIAIIGAFALGFISRLPAHTETSGNGTIPPTSTPTRDGSITPHRPFPRRWFIPFVKR